MGLCKLVLAVFETVAFVADEDSKLHDLKPGKINVSCVCRRHLSVKMSLMLVSYRVFHFSLAQ